MKRLLPIFLFAIYGLFLTACQPQLSYEQKRTELFKVFEWQNKVNKWTIMYGVQNTFSYINEMTPRQLEKYDSVKFDEYKLDMLASLYFIQYKPDLNQILKNNPPKSADDFFPEAIKRFRDNALDIKIGSYKENVFEVLGSRGYFAHKIYKDIFDPLLAELDNMKIQDREIKEYVKKLRTLVMLNYDEIYGFKLYSSVYDHRDQEPLRQTWVNAETEFIEAAKPLYINYCLPDCPFKEGETFLHFIYYGDVFSKDN